MQEMRELVGLLNSYARAYYELDAPKVSDAEYDRLYARLKKMEEKTGVILPDSPTLRIGGEPLVKFKKHTHKNKLYSLDKATDESSLERFFERLEKAEEHPKYTVEYKFDGLTVCLTYKNGEFVSAATRGNGSVGEDVTAQVLTVAAFPRTVDYKGVLEVQGEAVISLRSLEKYNKTAKERLKNARNAAAGAVRNLDLEETKRRNIEILFYNINYPESGVVQSQSECMRFLRRNNFPAFEYFKECFSRSEVIAAVEEIRENRLNINYLTDGAVIKADDFGLRKKLGHTAKFPRWAVAFKFEAQEQTTVINDVIWQVGRTGKLTPLALVEGVELAGATVKRATLNNYGDILRKNVKIGSTVAIRRSNDVIPEILGAVDAAGDDVQAGEAGLTEIQKPEHCPECGSAAEEKGANLFCFNFDCPARVIGRLTHYASESAADIAGLSEKTAEILYKSLGITQPFALYNLTLDDLLKLEGFKQKKAENLLNALKKSKNISFSKFIYALGIDGIGAKTAADLAAAYKDIDALKGADTQSLLQIEEVGEILADNITAYFSDNKNLQLVDALLSADVRPKAPETAAQTGVFSGENFVLTGTLENYSRKEAQEIIERLGGKVSSSVTSAVTVVLAGENAGSKLSKARETGIKIMDEAQFIKLIKT